MADICMNWTPSQEELAAQASMLREVRKQAVPTPTPFGQAADEDAIQAIGKTVCELGADIDRVAAAFGCSPVLMRRFQPRDVRDFAEKLLAGVYTEGDFASRAAAAAAAAASGSAPVFAPVQSCGVALENHRQMRRRLS